MNLRENNEVIEFAIKAHSNVNHTYNGMPYSVHLSLVNLFAVKYLELIPEKHRDIVIQACWLHDTIEDCRLTFNDIKEFAGEEVANIVYAVTNEKGKNRAERANAKYYEGIVNTLYADFVKLCDRLANVWYSKETVSHMLKAYKRENKHFIDSISKNNATIHIYTKMIEDLNQKLN